MRTTLEVGALALAILIPLSVHAGLFGMFFDRETLSPSSPEATVGIGSPSGPADMALLSAVQNPNPSGGRGGGDVVVDGGALVSRGPVGADVIAKTQNQTGEIRVYTVKPGDTLSQIAEMFDVTANTVRWANDLGRAAIQPGDSLIILPIVGVRHVVKDGDTIGSIAKKYEGDGDEILAYNQLPDASALSVGDTLIIPGGAVHRAPAPTPTRTRTAVASTPAPATSASGGYYAHPAPGALKTQGLHGYNAVDLAAGHGSPIRAAAAGEVIVSKNSGWNGGYGKYIVVRHPNGTQTLYSHLSTNYVGVGAYVAQGETIGTMGSTGRSTGTHLHFEVRGARNPF